MKLHKNADFDKYAYSGFVIGFDARSHFSRLRSRSHFSREWVTYVVAFGADNGSSVHVEKFKKDILVIGEFQHNN